MECHQKQIMPNWLNNDINYYGMLTDAFILQDLSNQKHVLKGEQRSQIDQELIAIAESNYEQQEQNNTRTEYLITKDEQLKEYTIFKKGGTFSSMCQRQCIFNQTSISQINKSGQIDKDFGIPTQMTIELKTQNIKSNPWDQNNSKNLARIVYKFQKHAPAWIYIKDQAEAVKIRNYFISQNIILNLDGIIKQVIKESNSLMVDELSMNLADQLNTYAIKSVIQKKKAAKISQKEKKFLEEIDFKMLKLVMLKKWLVYSNGFKRKDDQVKEIEDAERIKLEQIRMETENKKSKWRTFLESKQIMKVDTLSVLKSLTVDWLEKCEEIQYHQQVKSLIFVWHFQSINIDESIYLIKPQLSVSLSSVINENDPINAKDSQLININYFNLKMDAFLGQQRTDNYYNWLLREKIFENSSHGKIKQGNMVRNLCQINVSDIQEEDKITFHFQDMINSFYDSISEPYSINIRDILENIQSGRSIWVPLTLIQTTPLKTESKRSKILIEIDIHVIPSAISQNINSYVQELEYLCLNNYPILDPIYLGTFQIPQLNKDLVKQVIMSFAQNEQCLKLSLQMMNFVFFMSNLDSNQFKEEANRLQFLSVRKSGEYICQSVKGIESQYKLYQQLLQKTEQMNILFNKNPQINAMINQLYIEGIPIYLRNRIWFHLLSGSYRNIIQIFQKLNINPNLRKLDKTESENGIIIAESTWSYWKLLKLKGQLPKNYTTLVDNYLRAEDGRKSIINETFYHMLKNLLINFLFYQFQMGLTPNPLFIQHIFTLGKRILSLQCYHYIPTKQYFSFLLDDENEDQTTYSLNQQYKECTKESRAFWLLIAFSNQILQDYPFYEQNKSKRLFQEDCSKLRVFLKRDHKKLYNQMFILGVSLENVLFECFFNLYSDVFPSELLYRIWDLIIYQQQLAIKDTKEKGVILIAVMGALLVRLNQKIQYISTHQNFLNAILIEALLIQDIHIFIQEILTIQKSILNAIKLEQEQEGPLQLEEQNEMFVKPDVRAFDIQMIRQAKPSQQLSLHEYMNMIDF